MNPYVAYDAVSTKIKAKKGRLLDENDWNRILSCTSVEQVTNFLKERPELKDIMEAIKKGELHRDDLETVLGRFRVKEIEDILHYFSGPYKQFLQTMLLEFEITDLLLITRKVVQSDNMVDVKRHFIHSEKHSNLPYDKLISSTNINELIENLKNTPYYTRFTSSGNEDIVKREFHIEMKLQMLLYNMLFKKSKNLSRQDISDINNILGLIIDLENIQWIYRAMKYYRISPEETLNYCLPDGKKITYYRLKKLCYVKSVAELKSMSAKLLGVDIFKAEDNVGLEKGIDRYIYRYLQKRDNSQKTIGTALAYFYMNSIIIKDLVAVTEGIKYKLPKEKLKEYLVHAI